MNPKYPVYVISKGRWELRHTSKALEKMKVPYRIVVEPQEFKEYAAVIDKRKILQLPFSNLGQGSIPARNWVWEHAIEAGHKRHWILDDNIMWFARIQQNKKIKVVDGLCFRLCEWLTDQYENVALAGLEYEMFIPALQAIQNPFRLNTRVYSCILIKNDLTLRWRGRYNEDTDLSLRCLKAGWCSILLQAFVCKKLATMTCRGGNTEDLYKDDGRLKMAQSLQHQHPDVVRVAKRFSRYQHVVDYRPFKKNRLRKKTGQLEKRPNFEMELIKVKANG